MCIPVVILDCTPAACHLPSWRDVVTVDAKSACDRSCNTNLVAAAELISMGSSSSKTEVAAEENGRTSPASPGSPGKTKGWRKTKEPAKSQRRVDRMTEGQLFEFREAFYQFDKDRSGYIERHELRDLCEWVGQTVSEGELDEMMKLADGDNSGKIDFWEFATLMAHKMGDVNPDRTLYSAFAVFDSNGDGKISAQEITDVIREMGEPASDGDIKRVIGELDADGSGAIDYREFSQMVVKEMQESGFAIV